MFSLKLIITQMRLGFSIRAKIEANAELSKSMLRKNQGTWKLSQLKNLSFEEVKKEFDKLVKQDDEPTKKSGKRRKQMARKGLHTSVDKDDSEDSDEVGEQEESVTGAYQIVREDGTDVVYINFGAMLKVISRDDLTELYRIVMNRYGMDGPEDELEKVFWKYLKNMFEEPLSTDPIWSELGQQRIIRVNTPGSDENRLKLYDLMYILSMLLI
ncbi:hypothetical protein Tco_1370145 [Tanacetum coccineum]